MPTFNMNKDASGDTHAGRLTIVTDTMVMSFEEGAVVYVKDVVSDEVLLDSDTNDALFPSSAPGGFVGFVSNVPNISAAAYRFPSNTVTPTFTSDGADSGHVTYSPCVSDVTATGTSLVYYFTVTTTGEVVITALGTDDATNSNVPYSIELFLFKFTGSGGCILGNGRHYPRSAATVTERTYNRWPQAAVCQGSSSVIGIWSENINADAGWNTANFNTDPDKLTINHDNTNGCDHLTLHLPLKESTIPSGGTNTIDGGPWVVGTYSSWLAMAKRWRERFEDRGAIPLWNNPVEWVRNVHALVDSFNTLNYVDYIPQSYNDLTTGLAAVTSDESRLMLLWWNAATSNFIEDEGRTTNIEQILFGDPTTTTGGYASDYWIDYMRNTLGKQYPLMTYSPWVMYYYDTPAGLMISRMYREGLIPSVNWLNQSADGSTTYYPYYQFAPSYPTDHDVVDWYSMWSDFVNSPYYYNPSFGPEVGVIHPGDSNFPPYFKQYTTDYCTLHQSQGVYIDIAGVHWGSLFFPNSMKVYNNLNFAQGEKAALVHVQETQQYGFMSELLAYDLVPYCAMTWWGQNGENNGTGPYSESAFVLTHPFRTALIGSYVWCRAINHTYFENAADVTWKTDLLGGAMPTVEPHLRYLIDSTVETTCRMVGRLYCERRLVNDLPPVTWENDNTFTGTYPNTLAYFKSLDTENMVRAEDRGSNVLAFVEEHPNGDYDRLVITDGAVTLDNIDEILPGVRSYSRYHYMTLPADDADLTTVYTPQDLLDVALDDSTRVGESGTGYILHEFKEVAGPYDTKVDLHCNLQAPLAPSDYPVYLQCYDRVTIGGMWVTVVTNNAATANTDFDMDFTLDSETTPTFANCKDEDGTISSRVWQTNVPLS